MAGDHSVLRYQSGIGLLSRNLMDDR